MVPCCEFPAFQLMVGVPAPWIGALLWWEHPFDLRTCPPSLPLPPRLECSPARWRPPGGGSNCRVLKFFTVTTASGSSLVEPVINGDFSFPDFCTVPSRGPWVWCRGGWCGGGRPAGRIWPLRSRFQHSLCHKAVPHQVPHCRGPGMRRCSRAHSACEVPLKEPCPALCPLCSWHSVPRALCPLSPPTPWGCVPPVSTPVMTLHLPPSWCDHLPCTCPTWTSGLCACPVSAGDAGPASSTGDGLWWWHKCAAESSGLYCSGFREGGEWGGNLGDFMVVVFHSRHTVGSAWLTCREYPRATRGCLF